MAHLFSTPLVWGRGGGSSPLVSWSTGGWSCAPAGSNDTGLKGPMWKNVDTWLNATMHVAQAGLDGASALDLGEGKNGVRGIGGEINLFHCELEKWEDWLWR